MELSDEVSKLGVSWVDESALRSDVAAEVDARACPGAAADELELRRRWAALEETERAVGELRVALAAVEQGAAGGQKKKREEEGGGAAALRFRLAKAQREVESRASSVRRWQREMEARQRKRLEEAKQRSRLTERKETAALPQSSCAPAGGALAVLFAASASLATDTSTGATTTTVERRNSYPCDERVGLKSTASLISVASSPLAPNCATAKLRYPLQAAKLPENAAVAVRSGTATELRRRDEEYGGHGGCLTSPGARRTLSEYSGGAILPSLYRVTLTHSDVSSKSRRYADDGDLGAFHARQQKRRRLEEIVAGMSTLQSTSLLPDYANDSADSGTISMEIKHSKEEEKSGCTHATAIDVDALMEESDDDAEILLRQHLASAAQNIDDKPVKKEYHEMFVSLVDGISLPVSIDRRLLDYQREGVRWLLQLHMKRAGGILGDEMGLGKTIQIATMLNALHNSQQLHGPCLILSPLTVLRQWVAELHRWAPYMRICVMHESSGTSMSREELLASIRRTPAVLLTTYTAVRQYCQLLHTAEFQYVIIDEGHKISNPEATLTLAVKSFPTPHRLILSGTPIQNTLKELWSLFDFVKPGLLGTMTKFVGEFEEPINASKNVNASSLVLATAVECARALQERIAPYLLRRLKRDVLSHLLPHKYERVIRCPLSDSQLEAYVELLLSPRVQRVLGSTLSHTQLVGGLDRDGRDSSGCLNIAGRRFQLTQRQQQGGIRLELFCVLAELRKICNHVDVFRMRQAAAEEAQYCFDDDVDYTASDFDTLTGHDNKKKRRGEQTKRRSFHMSLRSNLPVDYQGSGKLLTLQKLMKVWQNGGQRVLIFSQTRMMLDIIENMCEQEGFTYIRMDGSTNSHHRQELMDRFNEDTSIIAALLTTRVGGVGVNLVGANRVVLFDPDWNPVTDEQARERAWRIGQKSDVCVYRLISSGTVEEAILRRQLAKTYVSEKVLHNPELQRFFHQSKTLAETFYLGAEYDSRVPPGKKHVLVAQELSPLLEQDEESLCDGGESNTTNYNNSYTAAAEEKANKVNISDGKEGCGHLHVKKEIDSVVYRIRPIDSNVADKNNSCGNNNTKSCDKSAGVVLKKEEMALLQDLVDGNEVSLSATDVMAWRLARMSASRTVLRATNTVRTIEDQQREMRLKYLAEREEKGKNKNKKKE